MGDMMLIYEAVKAKLGPEYTNIFFQTMREDVPGDVGIYLYESSDDVESLDGNPVYNCIKVHVQVNCEQSADGMKKALNYLTNFVFKMEHERSDVAGISFVAAKHKGPRAVPIGKNSYNILICKSTVDLKYIF